MEETKNYIEKSRTLSLMILLHEINPKLYWLLAPEPDLGYGRFRPMSLVARDKAFCAESMK